MKNIGKWAGTMVTALVAGLTAGPSFAGQLLTTHVPDPVARHVVQIAGAPDRDAVLHLDVVLPSCSRSTTRRARSIATT
jgi:hypothetical protein